MPYQERNMIRKLKPDDAVKIEELLRKVKNFSDKEFDVAMELVTIAACNPDQTDYHIFIFESGDEVAGYYCVGRRPLTDGVFDLYWIASSPDSKMKGIGKSLLEHAEEFVKNNNGRLLLAETSSKESYSKTRDFYLRNDYSVVAGIKDFYSVGDDLVVFGKYFF